MNAKAKTINARIDLLLGKVRIAPAGQREKLMAQVRKLRTDRDLAILEGNVFKIEIEFELGGANGVYFIKAANVAKAKELAIIEAEKQDLVAGVVAASKA